MPTRAILVFVLLLVFGGACRAPQQHSLALPQLDPTPAPRAEGPAYLGIIYVTDRQLIGVRVVDVLPLSPAERAGIREGDMIFYANGQAVGGGAMLRALIDSMRPGAALDLELRRLDGSARKVTAQLEPLPIGNPWMRGMNPPTAP